LRCDATNRQDYFRLDEFNLTLEIVATSGRLTGLRVSIIRRPALENIGDKYTLAPLTHGAQHLVKQFSGSTDERLAAPVFLSTGSLTNDEPIRLGVADTKYRLRPAFVQRTLRTGCDGVPKLRPVHCAGSRLLCSAIVNRLHLIAGHPDINSERLEIGTALMFCLDHYGFPAHDSRAVSLPRRMTLFTLVSTRFDT
jgi:hypothetical protein